VSDWLRDIDGWTWFKVTCLMAFATGVGLLKRHMTEQQLREIDEENRLNKRCRFIDPFDS